jgi:hypothetical protein
MSRNFADVCIQAYAKKTMFRLYLVYELLTGHCAKLKKGLQGFVGLISLVGSAGSTSSIGLVSLTSLVGSAGLNVQEVQKV